MEQTFDFAPTLLVRNNGAASEQMQLSCVTGKPVDDGLCRLVAFTEHQEAVQAISNIFDGRCRTDRGMYHWIIYLCCEPEHVAKMDALYDKTRERGNLISKSMVEEIFGKKAAPKRDIHKKPVTSQELTLS